jgi:signal transduction histidine kinase
MVSDKSSLRRRLPAWIALVVAITVTTFGALAYGAAKGATERATWVRLRSAADRFAALSRVGMTGRLDAVRGAARDERVVAFLAGSGSRDSALALLGSLGPDTGATIAVGLRDHSGAGVLFLVHAIGTAPTHPAKADSAQVSPFFARGDTVAFETTAPVMRGKQLLGYVVVTRMVRSTPAAVQTLSELVRPNAILLVGNRDGSLWSDLLSPVQPRPAAATNVTYERDGQLWMLSASPIQDTPFAMAVEVPASEGSVQVRSLPWTFALLGSAVVLAGALLGWLVTRRITDPLVKLTAAAESIAAGSVQADLPPAASNDEVGRLDRAFTAMAESVRLGRERLERQVSQRTEELHRAQADLIRQEKMAVLGQLASSVGHELRNPLGVMANCVYYLSEVLPEAPPKAREHLAMLKRQIGLAEKIVSDILDFTRVKVPETQDVSVAEFIDEQLHRVTIPPTVRVRREIGSNLPLVRADPVQIGQVLYNLLTNAIQAMDPAGGVLTVRTRPVEGVLRIEVGDEGPGVPAESRDRIFEPLFTTKLRGIGLGLSVSRSLAQANGGSLAVANGNGSGAVFWLDLPVKS